MSLSRLTQALCVVLGIASSSSVLAANSLKDILQFALKQDPTLLEAKAEQEAAIQTRKGSEALHYPTLALTSSQILTQQHEYESNYRKRTDVGVQGKLNLYSWGGIEATVKRDKQKERFAYYKFFETREELGAKIADLYASALFYKESLIIANNNLSRHQQFLDNLKIVSQYDTGRASEYAQAESRFLAAESRIVDLQRSLETTIAKLNLYTPAKLTVDDITEPFKKHTAKNLIEQFPQPNEKTHPSILAQVAERDSAEADIDVANASTLPQINLEGLASRNDRSLEVTFSWDLFNRPSHFNTETTRAKLYSAEARTEQIKRDIAERFETAKIEMMQSENQARISKRHIDVQERVAADYAEQFKVSRRSLLEVLDAYAELSNIENTYVNARHNFRLSTIAFLLSQAKIAHWAGLAENL